MSAYTESLRSLSLAKRQEQLWLNPQAAVDDYFEEIYGPEQRIEIGWPDGIQRQRTDITRPNSAMAVGIDYGDEGKGRGADNDADMLLSRPGVKSIDVTRSAGGHNAGHTIVVNGKRLALHIIPSAVAHERSRNIIGRETSVHPEDLKSEFEDVEDKVGKGFLQGRVVVSEEAKFNHDIDRAEEVLLRLRTEGQSSGGTGRGIPTTEAHRYDRTGLSIGELTQDNWRSRLGNYYDDMERIFDSFGRDLSTSEVPDFQKTLETNEPQVRTVGTKNEFLDRVDHSREWLISQNMVQNTVAIHRESYKDPSVAQLFEGAQAMGLHPSLGKRKDVTSTDPSGYMVMNGTAVYLPQNIEYRRGYSKGRYNSVVGADWPRQLELDEATAQWIQEEAHEYGATTGRKRTILGPNITMEQLNARFSMIEGMVETHIDVAKANEKIKIAAYFVDQEGVVQHYQPGLIYQKGLIPVWVEVPGWDGEQVKKAKRIEDLPFEALQFLSFKQALTGYPIEAITTGPQRENFIELKGYR